MRIVSIIVLCIIVVFVNFNEVTPLWDLFYYLQNYIIVAAFVYFGFLVRKDVLTRSVLIALGFYNLFELSIDIIGIFDNDLKEFWYSTNTINCVLGLGIGLSLFILPIIKKCK